MKTYKSKACQQLYNSFNDMFQQEGDVYDSIKESIESGYKSQSLDNNLGKVVSLSILEDVACDFYAKELKLLTEEEFLETINN